MAEDVTEKKDAVKDAPDAKEEQAVIAYHYVPDENSVGGSYPGVPPGDILQHVYDAQPEWIQKSIAANPMYKAAAPKKPDKAKESEK